MLKLLSSRFVPFLSIFFLHSQNSHAQWAVTILHPPGALASAGNAISGNTQGGVATFNSGDPPQAAIWSGSAGSVVDLHQPGWIDGSSVNGVSGSTSVGYVGPTQGAEHATLWTNNTAASAVSLHPSSGFSHSRATAVSGNIQVGYGINDSGYDRALLWSGTAASLVALHPANVDGNSQAYGVFGNNQVGFLEDFSVPVINGYEHASLWHGTAASRIDLHPSTGFFESTIAYGVDANSQVGWGQVNNTVLNHALLWSGTAASMIDLNPLGYASSAAYGVAGNIQVGEGAASLGNSHAMLWTGSAGSFIDLHSFLPLGFDQSTALGIDPNTGNIIGVAYTGFTRYAVMWTPIPEPSTMVLCGLGAIGLLVAARRRRK